MNDLGDKTGPPPEYEYAPSATAPPLENPSLPAYYQPTPAPYQPPAGDVFVNERQAYQPPPGFVLVQAPPPGYVLAPAVQQPPPGYVLAPAPQVTPQHQQQQLDQHPAEVVPQDVQMTEEGRQKSKKSHHPRWEKCCDCCFSEDGTQAFLF